MDEPVVMGKKQVLIPSQNGYQALLERNVPGPKRGVVGNRRRPQSPLQQSQWPYVLVRQSAVAEVEITYKKIVKGLWIYQWGWIAAPYSGAFPLFTLQKEWIPSSLAVLQQFAGSLPLVKARATQTLRCGMQCMSCV